MFYDHYESLEVHFSRSHYICPYDSCKAKCYVAFQTENELQAHLNIAHSRGNDQSKVNANALLGFTAADEESRRKTYNKPEEKKKLMDSEGVDFSYYFSSKYMNKHDRPATGRGGRGGRGRGEDRGRGGGRGRGRGRGRGDGGAE